MSCVSLYGDHAFVWIKSTENHVHVCILSVCVSLYGDYAFVWVMSTEKCVYVCMCMCVIFVCVCSLCCNQFFAGHVDCKVSCVSLYGDHAFVQGMSSEKHVHVCILSVCVSLYGNHAFVQVMSTE